MMYYLEYIMGVVGRRSVKNQFLIEYRLWPIFRREFFIRFRSPISSINELFKLWFVSSNVENSRVSLRHGWQVKSLFAFWLISMYSAGLIFAYVCIHMRKEKSHLEHLTKRWFFAIVQKHWLHATFIFGPWLGLIYSQSRNNRKWLGLTNY